jgi:hypothetical protein
VSSILAHGLAGDILPLPRWLLAYLLAFVVLLVALAMRVTSPRARWSARTEEDVALREGRALVPSFIGLAVYVALLVLAAASETGEVGFVTVTVIVVLWLGGLVAAAVTGGWLAWFSPFEAIGWIVDRRDPDEERPEAPVWTAAVGLFAFIWFWLVYGLRAPTDREIATFLAVYAVAITAGISVWGRAWLRRGEALSAVFSLVGWRSLARRGAVPGTTALVAVLLGGVAFEGLSQTSWWLDVLGNKTGVTLDAVNTIGLLWVTVVVGAATVGAARAGARLAGSDAPELADRFAAAVVPIAVACWFAHELSTFLIDSQNFIALASDPLGRGWDLFGTIDNPTNYAVLTPTQTATVGTVALLVGGAGSAVLAHEAAFASLTPRAALKAEWPLIITLMVAMIAATGLLLGT